MLCTYEDLSAVKSDIKQYVDLVNNDNLFSETHIVVGVTKYILFIKQIQEYKSDKYYGKCMICDLLLLMHATTQTSIKNFYSQYRSFIENYIRFILDINDTDETGVRNLFSLLDTLCVTEKEREIKNYIEGEYGKCCEYVHSNINANINLYAYYEDIIRQDEVNLEVRQRLIKIVLSNLKQLSELLIRTRTYWVDTSFYRDKQKLKYLISENLYNDFNLIINVSNT